MKPARILTGIDMGRPLQRVCMMSHECIRKLCCRRPEIWFVCTRMDAATASSSSLASGGERAPIVMNRMAEGRETFVEIFQETARGKTTGVWQLHEFLQRQGREKVAAYRSLSVSKQFCFHSWASMRYFVRTTDQYPSLLSHVWGNK